MDDGVGSCPGTITFFSRKEDVIFIMCMQVNDLTLDNMEAMYEMTYETWAFARVAVKIRSQSGIM